MGTVVKIGFTGTRRGMTPVQKAAFFEFIQPYAYYENVLFIHGDCIGADKEAHDMMRTIKSVKIKARIPDRSSNRAFCDADIIEKPKDYLSRNHDIVNECDYLVACPRSAEERRSGTWATIRYARKCGKKIVMISTCGTISIEENN